MIILNITEFIFSKKMIMLLIGIYILFICKVSYSQDSVMIYPIKPTSSSPIEIIYILQNDSLLAKSDSIFFKIKFFRFDQELIIRHFPGKSDKSILLFFYKLPDGIILEESILKKWQDTFRIKYNIQNDSMVYFCFGFGQNLDDIHLQYESYIYDEKGNVKKGGYIQKYLNNYFSTSDSIKNVLIEKELECHQPLFFAEFESIICKLNKISAERQKKEEVENELRNLISRNLNNEEILINIYRYIYPYQFEEIKYELKMDLQNEFPYGGSSFIIELIDLMNSPKTSDGLKYLKKLINHYKNSNLGELDMAKRMLYDFLNKFKKPVKDYLKNIKFENFGYYYNDIAANEIFNKTHSDELIYFIKNGLEFFNNQNPDKKSGHESISGFNAYNNYYKGRLYGLLGSCYFRLNNYLAAEDAFKKYAEISNYDEETTNKDYVEMLVKMEKYEKAMSVASISLRKAKASKQLIENYEIAYTNINGSDDGFKKMIEKENSKLKAIVDEIIKKRHNEKMTDVILKDMNGKNIKSSSLKGKIVILDFWAMWCQPCLEFLPIFQKISKEYNEDKEIAFFAINTKETSSMRKRIEKAKKLIDKNCSLSILFDTDNSSMSESLKINSIPTTIAIDKNGNISFRSEGFENELQMRRLISAWISELKK